MESRTEECKKQTKIRVETEAVEEKQGNREDKRVSYEKVGRIHPKN